MKIRLTTVAVPMTIAAITLAGCAGLRQGQDNMPAGVQPAVPNVITEQRQRTSSGEQIVYRFDRKNGVNPEGVAYAEVYGADMLFGTTHDGGSSRCRGTGSGGCGTIFGVSVDGKHYPFFLRLPRRGAGGTFPEAGLVYAGGELFYGTTAFGGASGCGGKGCGTVFALVPFGTSSTYFIFHRFAGREDGKEPVALVQGKGALYGTTWAGGGSGCGGGGCGTVFSIALISGHESVVRFAGGAAGYEPNSLLAENGEFFGTTWSGGSGSGCAAYGCGTIFKFDAASGTLTVLYSFKGGADGAGPKNLIDVHGQLYGTTFYGGGSGCNGGGCGTVFKVNSKTGTEKVLYRFQGGSDGVGPDTMLSLHGALYGATYYGGAASACTTGYEGCGTIFEIDPEDNAYNVLYRFQGGSDGEYPTGLTKSSNALYGATWAGGGSGCGGPGCGTLFKTNS